MFGGANSGVGRVSLPKRRTIRQMRIVCLCLLDKKMIKTEAIEDVDKSDKFRNEFKKGPEAHKMQKCRHYEYNLK